MTRGQFRRFMPGDGLQNVCERAGGRGDGFDQATGKFKIDQKIQLAQHRVPQDDNHPVVNVSWRDAMAFCTWLTWKEGKLYRLPTEAEWEYACRAGTTTLFSSGDDPESLATIANVADESAKAKFPAGHCDQGSRRLCLHCASRIVQPNAFGLFDMHGNVREWCSDWYADDYYANSPDADPRGFFTGDRHVLRGGGWNSSAADCRCAARIRATSCRRPQSRLPRRCRSQR